MVGSLNVMVMCLITCLLLLRFARALSAVKSVYTQRQQQQSTWTHEFELCLCLVPTTLSTGCTLSYARSPGTRMCFIRISQLQPGLCVQSFGAGSDITKKFYYKNSSHTHTLTHNNSSSNKTKNGSVCDVPSHGMPWHSERGERTNEWKIFRLNQYDEQQPHDVFGLPRLWKQKW